jgi:hypothetical protein
LKKRRKEKEKKKRKKEKKGGDTSGFVLGSGELSMWAHGFPDFTLGSIIPSFITSPTTA